MDDFENPKLDGEEEELDETDLDDDLPEELDLEEGMGDDDEEEASEDESY